MIRRCVPRLLLAAQERGLPITIAAAVAAPAAATPSVSGTAAAATTAPRPAVPLSSAPAAASAVQVPTAGGLDAAHAAGANAALVAVLLPAQPGALQWTLSSADGGGGEWVGGPELAIDQAADTLATLARVINQSPVAQYVCHVSGVTDLEGLVGVLDAVHAAPGVTQVDVSDVDGDQLTLQLAARGSGPQLERALAGERLQATGTGTEGLLEYRYVAAR